MSVHTRTVHMGPEHFITCIQEKTEKNCTQHFKHTHTPDQRAWAQCALHPCAHRNSTNYHILYHTHVHIRATPIDTERSTRTCIEDQYQSTHTTPHTHVHTGLDTKRSTHTYTQAGVGCLRALRRTSKPSAPTCASLASKPKTPQV